MVALPDMIPKYTKHAKKQKMFWCDTASCWIVGKAQTPSGGITALRKGSISISWLDDIFYKWGYPHSWMVDFMENTIYRWMMIGGTPISGNLNIFPIEEIPWIMGISHFQRHLSWHTGRTEWGSLHLLFVEFLEVPGQHGQHGWWLVGYRICLKLWVEPIEIGGVHE